MPRTKTEPTKKRVGGPSGAHVAPRRLLTQPAEAWEAQDAHAAARGESWGEWARKALSETMRRQGAKK